MIAIIPTADRSKATVKVRIAIKQKDPRIVPDMGVRVAFLDAGEVRSPRRRARRARAGRRPCGPTAPPAWCSWSPADKVERRSVTLGPDTVGANRQVLSGLRDGERVVLAAAGVAQGRRRRPAGRRQ